MVGQGEEVLCVLKDPPPLQNPWGSLRPGARSGPMVVLLGRGSGRGCGRAEFQPIADLFGPGSVPYLHIFFLT